MFNSWVGKIPWRRKWQPLPVLLPEEFHGQRSLAGYSPWGRKESDTTEQLHFFTSSDNYSDLPKSIIFFLFTSKKYMCKKLCEAYMSKLVLPHLKIKIEQVGKMIKYNVYYKYFYACNNRQNYKIPCRMRLHME